jgi:translation elongation factor EF-Tu-like GTPase
MNLLGLKDGMYILETVYDSGIKKHLYFDAGTFLLTKEDAPRKTPRGEVITTQKYSNYKEVSGVMLPGIIESELGGPVLKAEVGYEINKPIEDKEFTP